VHRPASGVTRRTIALLLPLLAVLGAVPAASAQTSPEPRPTAQFRNCGTRTLGPTQCANVRVPLDRGGAVAGDIRLAVRRVQVGRRKVGERSQAVLFLAGGPGQATTPLAGDVARLLRPLLTHRDLVTIDTRGTGRSSDLVVCPEIEALADSVAVDPRTLASCARRLGPAAPFYGTADVVADIEAVRRAAGYDKLLVVGVSYGSYTAQRYAAAHPDRVTGLVLDSPVDVVGYDPFALASFRALPRVLEQACRKRVCARITDAPRTDLERAIARTPISVRVDGGRGKRVTTTIREDTLAGLISLGDLDPLMRASAPSLLRRLAEGDAQPLARFARELGLIARPDDDADPSAIAGAAGALSTGVYVATTCRDTHYPWTDATPLGADRMTAARAAVSAVPAAQRGGFGVGSIVEDWPVAACALWPVAPDRTTIPPLPEVPTLVLSGREDSRTPTEVARAITARMPKATLAVVPGVAHSVITSGSRCVQRLIRAYAAGTTGPRCPASPAPPAAPLPPRAASELGSTGRERALGVARATVEDATRTLVLRLVQSFDLASLLSGEEFQPVRVAGLRSGSAVLTEEAMRLSRYGYVPGTSVTGALTDTKHVSVRVAGRGLRPGTYRIRNPIATDEDLRSALGLDEDEITIELSARVRAAIGRVARGS
jgi:pimeloyl-ACP methyl ester carboxylesterase